MKNKKFDKAKIDASMFSVVENVKLSTVVGGGNTQTCTGSKSTGNVTCKDDGADTM